MKRMAAKELTQWISSGVPESCMTHLSSLSSSLPETFELKQQADVEAINASNNQLFEQPANNHLVFFFILNWCRLSFIIYFLYDCNTFRKLKPLLLEIWSVPRRTDFLLNHVSYIKWLYPSAILTKKV